MDKISIEEVRTEEEITELCVMAKGIWEEYFTPIIGEGQVAYMLDKFQSPPAVTAQLQEGYRYYRFIRQGEYIGYTGIHPEEKELFLSKLYLKKEYRGKGYARQALTFLEEFCGREGLQSIYLTVNRHNDSTIVIYRKLGFETIREQKADIGDGYYMDDFVMQKAL